MNTDMQKYTMCTCGHNIDKWKKVKLDRLENYSMVITNSQLLINHRTIRVTMWERRALFHNLFEWLLKQILSFKGIMFLIIGNVHVMAPEKLLVETLAHLKITNSIIVFWSKCFPSLWNGISDLHFFGTSWPRLGLGRLSCFLLHRKI